MNRRSQSTPTGARRARDLQIIACLERGLSRTQIAQRLGISYWAVTNAVRNWQAGGGAQRAGEIQSARDSQIIGSLQQGLTRAQTARRFSVSYWVVAKVARTWEMSGGQPLPRDSRGRRRQSLHDVTDRERDIVAAYRSPLRPTMRTLASRYQISAERIRQLIVAYERKTGDRVQRP